ncbi:zinc-binding dehydrogenase [Streptosporangium sp. NBC_01639]|uniref:zinc-binding dehydrogenase n=1 Tax=Streptosporangium sp. NBC_01639 TaxID=2975948 RepID=UPI0038683F06|nr:zinc-binding dehydrogenase [Streptosporangium sp. NBC_01639]
MQALISDPDTPAGVRLGQVPQPVPQAAEAVIEVEWFTLLARNLDHAATLPPGSIPGFDAVGTVRRAAEDGTGPAPGTRVATLMTGNAWAQLRAVSTSELAIVPEQVDSGQATTLLVPGVSALRAVRRLGALAGRRLLVTGAAGAVGHFAVQLGRLAGAYVIAAVRDPGSRDRLVGLGADEVVTELGQVSAPVHGVIESVGGPLLAQAFDLLAEDGLIQQVGASSGQPTTFAPYQMVGRRRAIEGFWAGDRFGPDLSYLLDLLAEGKLVPLNDERATWDDIDALSQRLRAADAPRRLVVAAWRTLAS